MQTTERQGMIGASDVPVILGLNPWKSPLQLWAEKTGELEQKEAGEAAEWGQRLERVVSKKFAELHNCKVIAYKKRYEHPGLPYFSCELDNIIAGTDELVEIKTVNAYQWKSWKDENELPDYVIAQVMAQMGLSNRSKAWIACLCGGQKYIEKQIDFDKEFFDKIVNEVKKFWDMVQSKTPPMASSLDGSTLLDLYPDNTEITVEATGDKIELLNEACAYRNELTAELLQKKEELEGINAKIKQIVGDNEGVKTDKFLITWKKQKTVPKTLFDKMKEDGVYDRYTLENYTRVLRIKKQKEVKNG